MSFTRLRQSISGSASKKSIKIGGPALANRLDWAEEFISQLKASLDFFSWHIYSYEPEKIIDRAVKVRAILDKNGFKGTESILNEWNYVKSFIGDDWIYSLEMEKNLKGASFIASTMALCQYTDLDMLMYYDARPCGMNGMYSTDLICECLKGYYPFRMFNALYKLGEAVEVENADGIYMCGAKGEKEAAIMLTHYNDDDNTAAKNVKIDMSGFKGENGVKAKYYLLDEDKDASLVREEVFSGDSYSAILDMTLFSTYLITLEKI